MTLKKVLILGRNGQLGWELKNLISQKANQVFSFSSAELDLRQATEIKKKIEEIQPQVIINASAYTAVDRAEKEPDIAKQINAIAPAIIAEEAKKLNALFIHYSTDYVFDGTKNIPYVETDNTNPLNVYGKSKLEGEQAVSQIGGTFLIFRTSWVYSMRRDNFVTKILNWAYQKESLQIVTDQIGSPTWARALAKITVDLINQGEPNIIDYFSAVKGIYHLGGLGCVSRYEFAKTILKFDANLASQKVKNVRQALTSDFPTPAIRPLATPLNCTYFEKKFGLQLPNWDDSLKIALSEMKT